MQKNIQKNMKDIMITMASIFCKGATFSITTDFTSIKMDLMKLGDTMTIILANIWLPQVQRSKMTLITICILINIMNSYVILKIQKEKMRRIYMINSMLLILNLCLIMQNLHIASYNRILFKIILNKFLKQLRVPIIMIQMNI